MSIVGTSQASTGYIYTTGADTQNHFNTLNVNSNLITDSNMVLRDVIDEINAQISGNRAPEVSMETKNKVAFKNGRIIVDLFDNGYKTNSYNILSDIVDVKVYPNWQSPRAVEVFFADSTSEKSTLDGNDEFNLDIGITYCIAKKLISAISDANYSTSILNKIVRRARNVMESNEKRHQKEIELKHFAEEKRAKMAAKKQRRDAKKINENTEAFISLLETAIIRAHKSIQESNDNSEG